MFKVCKVYITISYQLPGTTNRKNTHKAPLDIYNPIISDYKVKCLYGAMNFRSMSVFAAAWLKVIIYS